MTCSAEEKLELEVQKAALKELIVEVQAALEAIQEALKDLTGTTLEIVTTPLPTSPIVTTTAASRMRMRGFVNQFKI